MPVGSITVLVPVLGRPHRVRPFLDALHGSSLPTTSCVFVCSPGDDDELREILEAGADAIVVPWQPGPGDYARKINLAARSTESEWVFTGADDLEFTPGWDLLALTDAGAAGVVGTNDDCNALTRDGRHSTHSLVARWYVERHGTIDEPGLVLHEGYDHQYVDTELVATARARGLYAHSGAVVRHLHPMRRRTVMDDTYRKALRHGQADARLFRRRRSLWDRRPS